MADYKNYLAANILSEDKVITYRLLSRALKVNVNTAKEMLYEFHRQQNAKKPGAVHATYLVSGTKQENHATESGGKKDGEDEYMQSSPFMSSSMPQQNEDTGETSVLSVSLVREEELENLKSQYDSIASIHIYSLGPHPLKELQLLTDCTREVQVLTATEDPVEYYPKYGTITNPLVKRRPNRRPPPPAAAPVKTPVPAAKAKAAESTKEAPKLLSSSSVKAEPKQQTTAAKDFFSKGKSNPKPAGTSDASSKESTPAPNQPASKKDASSIFKAFAKAKPKLKTEGSNLSAGAEDEVMKDAVHFDDDEEETYVPPVPKEESAGDRQSRKEREARLRAMMEEDDDEEVVPTPEPEHEPEEEEETILEKEKPKEEPEPATTVSGGRRRGRRRVVRKKTVKDEEGYLVTKEEQVWESFSEDEPVAPPARPKIPTNTASKAKKAPEKKGQGSIMSFFGKK